MKKQRFSYAYRVVAREVSRISRYVDLLLQWHPLAHDAGLLFSFVEAEQKRKVEEDSAAAVTKCLVSEEQTAVLLLNGNLNHSCDIHQILCDIKARIHRQTRVVAVLYNPYLAFLFRLLTKVGLRQGEMPTTFLTRTSLRQLAELAGFELVRVRPVLQFPFRLLLLGPLVNWLLRIIPGIRWLGLVSVAVLRPILPSATQPSLSIIVPARNEAGNIRRCVEELENLQHTSAQIIFVEGHSTDDTWKEILSLVEGYDGPFQLAALQQTGTGKNDAVRLGFEQANGEVLTILDADLSMPPELLVRFFEAYTGGHGDLINGSRLVYPIELGAMRRLNHVGNVAFAKALSFVLETPLSDSLCGTKMLSRHYYRSVLRWRDDFGDFDPFGDFELLFPAAALGLGLTDVFIPYRARSYGATNISRIAHGWQLLRMTTIGLFRMKLGQRF